MGRIQGFYIADESIKIKFHENSTPVAITHVNDFKYHFPDVDLSATSTLSSGSWTLYGVFFVYVISFLYAVFSLFTFLMSLSFQW